jgi:hypothetical protein
MNLATLETRQREICKLHGSPFVVSPANLKVGISENSKEDIIPLLAVPEGWRLCRRVV